MHVRLASQADIPALAQVHQGCFSRQKESALWMTCQLAAFPLKRVFLVEEGQNVIGYAIWAEKSGFRAEVVLELEQLGVAEIWRGKGAATQLMAESLAAIQPEIEKRDAVLKAVFVTTRADNKVQELYQRALGAQVVTRIPALFGGPDELVMIGPVTSYSLFT